MPDFIRLLHCNVKSHKFLAREFVAYWEQRENPGVREVPDSPSSGRWSLMSLANASKTLKDLARWIPCPDEGPMQGKMCWYVAPEVRASYELSDLPVPNQWTYTLEQGQRGRPKEAKTKDKPTSPTANKQPSPTVPKTINGSSITKFTKKLTLEERQNLNKRKSTTPVPQPPCKIKPKSLPTSPFSATSAFGKSLSTTKEINITSPKSSSVFDVKEQVKPKTTKSSSLNKITSFISPKSPVPTKETDSVFKSPGLLAPIKKTDPVFKSPGLIAPIKETDPVFKSPGLIAPIKETDPVFKSPGLIAPIKEAEPVFKSPGLIAPIKEADPVFKSPALAPPSSNAMFQSSGTEPPKDNTKSPGPVSSRTSPSASSLGDKKGRRVSILVSVPVGQDIPSKGEPPNCSVFSEKPTPPAAARAFPFSRCSEQEDEDCVMLE